MTIAIPSRSTHITQLLVSIRALETQEQLALMREIARLLEQHAKRPLCKVTRFRGAGQRAWHGIKSVDYVQHERESWN